MLVETGDILSSAYTTNYGSRTKSLRTIPRDNIPEGDIADKDVVRGYCPGVLYGDIVRGGIVLILQIIYLLYLTRDSLT